MDRIRFYVKRLKDLNADEIVVLSALTNSGGSFMRNTLERYQRTDLPTLSKKQMDDILIIIAKQSRRTVGWCLLDQKYATALCYSDRKKPSRVKLTFLNIYVHHDLREQKLGQRVFNRTLKELKSVGYNTVVVDGWNKRATSFYKKMGGLRDKEICPYNRYLVFEL